MISTLLSAVVLLGGPSINDRLVEAVRQNDLAKAKLLLQKGAKADYKAPDQTPVLLQAFRAKGDAEPMVRLLLKSGANAKAIDGFGWNALTLASPDVSLDLMKELIAKGADPNRIAMHGDPAIVRFAGTRLDIVKLLVEKGAKVDQEGYLGQNAFGEAAKWGRIDVMRYLLSVGANPKFEGDGKQTALHWAVGSDKDNSAVLDFLSGQGLDVNAATKSGVTPLHQVAMWGSEANAKWLLAHGANPDAKDEKGRTPLDTAIWFQKESKVDRSKVIALLKAR